MSMQLAASVAAASLAAPVGPSLAALVNTESLESAADKYRDFKEPTEAAQDKWVVQSIAGSGGAGRGRRGLGLGLGARGDAG